MIDVINSHSSAEVADEAGRAQAKEEIMKAINEKTRKTVALEVYFTSFAVQGQPAA